MYYYKYHHHFNLKHKNYLSINIAFFLENMANKLRGRKYFLNANEENNLVITF